MANITRSFSFTAQRYNTDELPLRALLEAYPWRIDLQLSAEPQKMLEALQIINDAIGPWVRHVWHDRLLIGARDRCSLEYARRSRWGRMPALLRHDCSPKDMAAYMLLSVCPRLLQDTGIVVTAVTVGSSVHDSASIALQPPTPRAPQVDNRHGTLELAPPAPMPRDARGYERLDGSSALYVLGL